MSRCQPTADGALNARHLEPQLEDPGTIGMCEQSSSGPPHTTGPCCASVSTIMPAWEILSGRRRLLL